jgi:hypothetical protein
LVDVAHQWRRMQRPSTSNAWPRSSTNADATSNKCDCSQQSAALTNACDSATYNMGSLRLGNVHNLVDSVEAQRSSSLKILAKHLVVRHAQHVVLRHHVQRLHNAWSTLQTTIRHLHWPQADGLLATCLVCCVRRDPVVRETRIRCVVVRLMRKQVDVHSCVTQAVVQLRVLGQCQFASALLGQLDVAGHVEVVQLGFVVGEEVCRSHHHDRVGGLAGLLLDQLLQHCWSLPKLQLRRVGLTNQSQQC